MYRGINLGPRGGKGREADADEGGNGDGTGAETRGRARRPGRGRGQERERDRRRKKGTKTEGQWGEQEESCGTESIRSVEDQALPFRTRHHIYYILYYTLYYTVDRKRVAPAGSQQLRAEDRAAPSRRCGTPGGEQATRDGSEEETVMPTAMGAGAGTSTRE